MLKSTVIHKGEATVNACTATVEICHPIEDHARQIMVWRNDPDSLAMSFHRTPKQWESFWPEFRNDYFRFPQLPPMFIQINGKRVGFLRFRPTSHPEIKGGRTVDVSINLDPEVRGQGYSSLALQTGIDFLRTLTMVDTVLAEVRHENAASHKAFLKAGFYKWGDAIHTVADTGESCPVTCYVFDVTPRYWATDRVFIVAEAGSNWRMGTNSRDAAMGRTLIDVAVAAGADAVKFQTYRPETVYVANAGSSNYLSDAGIKEDIQDIFADLAMPYELVGELASYAKSCGIAFMSTPFSSQDFAAVDPYVTVHKIASYEISHLHLLQLAAHSGKPLILSTGASTEDDIAWAVETYRAAGGGDLCLMQCTAKYPAPLDALNLQTIPWLKQRFGVAVGFSDHSRDPLPAPVAAVALGARVIEKHYTVDNRLPGPDHAFALMPKELQKMVTAIRQVEQTLGDGVKRVLPAEEELHAYAQRRVQAIQSIAKGQTFQEGVNIAILRPGRQNSGIHPRFLSQIEGRKAARAISLGDGIQIGDWE
ncbi:MAG: GNAT family N-acetyltransferase [Alphaproteobacteria bacterium]